MTGHALAYWTTPQPLDLPDLGPGLDGSLASSLEAALSEIAADPSVQALVVFGSRATGQAGVGSGSAGGGAQPPSRGGGEGVELVAPFPAPPALAPVGGLGGKRFGGCSPAGRFPLARDQ